MTIYKDKDVTLREFTEDDIENKIAWINNPENNLYLHYNLPLEYEKTKEWFKNKDNNIRLDCIIEYYEMPVGLIGLLAIDYINLKAEFYISMGETKYKRCGIATKASKALLDYAFNCLNLHKVYLNTDADNIIACKLYEKVGFVREGYFVKDLLYHGKFIDRIRYAVINEG